MRKNEKLFYGLAFLAFGILCMTWMKEDSFSLLGLVTVRCKTLGILLSVIGGWNLLTSDGFGDLLGEILAFPFRVLGWLLEYWYLTAAVVALVVWLGPKAVPEEKPSSAVVPVWTEISVPVTAPLVTEPPATVPPQTEAIRQPYPGMHRNAGLCENLCRDSMMLVVYVNDSGSEWTQQEIQTFQSNLLNPGLEFITYHAGQYGYNITMETCCYPDEAGNVKTMYYNGTVGDWDTGSVCTDLVDCAVTSYGFANSGDMIQNVRDYAGTDQVGIVFCLDKPGRSYAQWHDTRKDAVEYAVVFTSMEGTRSQPDVVAHEVMHLFGADDMYAEQGERENRARLAERWHPRELFYQGQWNLYDNYISSFTAYTVGWLDTLPAEYDCPEWWT